MIVDTTACTHTCSVDCSFSFSFFLKNSSLAASPRLEDGACILDF